MAQLVLRGPRDDAVQIGHKLHLCARPRQAQGHRRPRSFLKTDVITDHQGCGDVDRQCIPGANDGSAFKSIDEDDVRWV